MCVNTCKCWRLLDEWKTAWHWLSVRLCSVLLALLLHCPVYDSCQRTVTAHASYFTPQPLKLGLSSIKRPCPPSAVCSPLSSHLNQILHEIVLSRGLENGRLGEYSAGNAATFGSVPPSVLFSARRSRQLCAFLPGDFQPYFHRYSSTVEVVERWAAYRMLHFSRI